VEQGAVEQHPVGARAGRPDHVERRGRDLQVHRHDVDVPGEPLGLQRQPPGREREHPGAGRAEGAGQRVGDGAGALRLGALTEAEEVKR
jgi:hypothetical protein